MKKRWLFGLLVLLAPLCFGGGQKPAQGDQQKLITLRYIMRYFDGDTGAVDKLWYPVYAKNNLGINFEIEQIPVNEAYERVMLMFASGDLPDIIHDIWLSKSDLVRFGTVEKQLLPLDQYLADMPHVAEALEKDQQLKLASYAPDGHMYSLPTIGPEYGNYTSRTFYNAAWRKTLGIAEPKTLDEFISMLKRFKNEDPGKVGKDRVIPVAGSWRNNDTSVGWILNAMGFLGGHVDAPLLREGKVVIPAGDPLYKEFLTIMKDLYDSKVLTPDYFTITDRPAMTAIWSEGVAGMIFDGPFLFPIKWQDYEAVTPLSSKWSTTAKWAKPNLYGTGAWCVSAKTKYAREIAQFSDKLFTPEGWALYNYGPPQGSDIAYGWTGYSFTDQNAVMYKEAREGKYNSDWQYRMSAICSIFPNRVGVTPAQQEENDILRSLAGLSGQLLGKPDLNDGNTFYSEELAKQAPYWEPGFIAGYYSDADNKIIADLGTVITNFIDTQTARFVTGARPLSEFDQYLRELNNLGFQDLLTVYKKVYNQ
jgi:putative aldouronate transport system substrate-binding protein